MPILRKLFFGSLAWLAAAWADAAEIDFTRDIRPLLSDRCFTCHGPDRKTRKADLRLDTKEGLLEGGAIVAGKPDESELVARLFHEDPDERMPPVKSKLRLSAAEKQLLKDWIAQGAEFKQHWAFEAPQRPADPAVSDDKWARNKIDRFVLARLEREKLKPSPEADRRTLIRRLSLDLTGLPPAAEETEAFVNDPAPDAYETLVKRLMESKHYGERMALPWLDAARYADSNGFQQDGDRNQYIWRDWVVRAMNDNLSFDQFTIWQLAGDLLESPTEDQLIATGFNRNHMLNGEGGAIAEEQRNNYVFDRVDTTSTIWLGLTLACAQCHDHKYDPLTTTDYYRFFAYFNNLPESGRVDRKNGRIQIAEPTMNLATPEQKEKEAKLNRDIAARDQILNADKAAIDRAVRAWWDGKHYEKEKLPDKLKPLTDRVFEAIVPAEQRLATSFFLKSGPNETWSKAQREKETIEEEREKLRREIPLIMVMRERPDVRPTHILDRGDYESPLDPVTAGIPEAFHDLPEGAAANRLALAQWLLAPENPLTSRVIVNRYWQHFFGMGLVKTAEDFGVQGEAPSHPGLLDWLAVEFRESGWDVKHLQRLIATSATYRQSSRVAEGMAERDPENRLLARGSRFRLPSLLLRDQALALSGLLNPQIGGRPVYPYQPPDLWKDFSYAKFRYNPDTGDKLYRRSLYIFWRRTLGPPTLFDTANRQVCTVKPKRTNTPLHALTTLNDPAYVEAARVWAERIIREGGDTPDARVKWAVRQATARDASEAEIAVLTGAVRKAGDHFGSHPEAATELLSVGEWKPDETLDPKEVASYTQVAQLILNLDEVLNRE